MPSLSGCGARPALDSCLNFSLLIGRNFLNCENRLLPVPGSVSGAGNCVSWIFIAFFLYIALYRRREDFMSYHYDIKRELTCDLNGQLFPLTNLFENLY